MCPLVRRLRFNLYGIQQFQIRWNNCISNMYKLTNGVKQGAVLSPILFTIYIDGLFYELKRAGVGCHIIYPKFQIRWNNCLSNMYTLTNGVKQGAVLSPILFTMYIDGLFYELKRAGVGCHING